MVISFWVPTIEVKLCLIFRRPWLKYMYWKSDRYNRLTTNLHLFSCLIYRVPTYFYLNCGHFVGKFNCCLLMCPLFTFNLLCSDSITDVIHSDAPRIENPTKIPSIPPTFPRKASPDMIYCSCLMIFLGTFVIWPLVESGNSNLTSVVWNSLASS